MSNPQKDKLFWVKYVEAGFIMSLWALIFPPYDITFWILAFWVLFLFGTGYFIILVTFFLLRFIMRIFATILSGVGAGFIASNMSKIVEDVLNFINEINETFLTMIFTEKIKNKIVMLWSRFKHLDFLRKLGVLSLVFVVFLLIIYIATPEPPEVAKNQNKKQITKQDTKKTYSGTPQEAKKTNSSKEKEETDPRLKVDLKLDIKHPRSYYYFEAGKIYYRNDKRVLKAVDKKTFQILSPFLAKDKNFVFVKGEISGRAVDSLHDVFKKIIDISTFQVPNPNSSIAKDKNTVYFFSDCSKKIHYLDDISPKKLKVISRNFFINKDNAFYTKGSCYFFPKIIKGVDLKTFESISEIFSKDKNNVYSKTKKLKNSDPETFEIKLRKDKYINFAKDKNNVYILEENSENEMRNRGILEGADPKTFELYGGFLGRDKNSVWCFNRSFFNKIDADASTFKYIEENIAKDKNGLVECK